MEDPKATGRCISIVPQTVWSAAQNINCDIASPRVGNLRFSNVQVCRRLDSLRLPLRERHHITRTSNSPSPRRWMSHRRPRESRLLSSDGDRNLPGSMTRFHCCMTDIARGERERDSLLLV